VLRAVPQASPRAAVVVTGSELIRGGRRDQNGPFLARELTARGLEPARITLVGDGADELEEALREGLEADLLVVSGGLGPTHDDRTVELLARAADLEARVDPALEREIEEVSRRIAERLGRPYADFEAGVRKQATIPDGGRAIGIAGTAPGLVVETDGAVAVVLPGPPPELQRLWRAALEAVPVQRVLARAEPPPRRVLRGQRIGGGEGAGRSRRGARRRAGNGVRARRRDLGRPLRRRAGPRGAAPRRAG